MIKTLDKKTFVQEMKTRQIDDSNVEQINEYFICIDSTGGTDSLPWFSKEHKNVCNLCFDDVDEDVVKWVVHLRKHIKHTAPTDEHIQKLFNFLNKLDKNKKLTVHCTKGQSRSLAIKDYIEWKNTGKHKDNGKAGSAYYRILEGLKRAH